jgi:hypothetical protein
MLTGLLVALLAAPAPGPRALPKAEVVTFLPRVDALKPTLPFFEHAGSRSVSLAPASWRRSLHPLLDVDVTSESSLALAGIDPSGALSRSSVGPLTVTCVQLTDVAKHQAAVEAHLQRQGDVVRSEAKGVLTLSSKDVLGRVQAAVAVKGKLSCAMAADGQSVERSFGLLTALLEAAPGAHPAPDVSAPLFVSFPPKGVTLALTAEGDSAKVLFRGTKEVGLAGLAGGGKSPFAALSAPGMLVVRARVSKAQLPGLVEQVLALVPGGKALASVAQQLSPALTGNVAFVGQQVKVTTGLRTKEARFYALKLALLAETSDPAQAQALVAQLDPKSLSSREGTLSVTVQGNLVCLSNDTATRESVLSAAATAAGSQKHGVEFTVDPTMLARGLAAVPLFEAIQTPELAGVVAASTEVGPLLLETRSVDGWLDGAAGAKKTGELRWVLKPEAAAPAP